MIRRITAASIAVLALAAPAAANVPHPGQYERQTISTTLCQTPQVLKTRVIGSADVVTRIQATVNGHGLTGWLEAKRTAGLGGYGVVA